MSEPRTAAGRALVSHMLGCPAGHTLTEDVLAIEAEAATLDVERLIQAVINTRFTWTDFRARFIAEQLAAEYAESQPAPSQDS